MHSQPDKLGRFAVAALIAAFVLLSALFLTRGAPKRFGLPLQATTWGAFDERELVEPGLPYAQQSGPIDLQASDVSRFDATPWLLPPNSRVNRWSGIHDLDMLMEMRSQPFGDLKAVTLLLFNKAYSIMAQNSSE